MFTRSHIAGSALLILTACCTHRAAGPLDVTGGPVRVTQQVFHDQAGNTVTLRLDDSAEARAQPLLVRDGSGATLKIFEYAVSDVGLCLLQDHAPSSSAADTTKHPPCQQASSITQGLWIKFGNASCTCTTVFQKLKCYGNTCP